MYWYSSKVYVTRIIQIARTGPGASQASFPGIKALGARRRLTERTCTAAGNHIYAAN